MFATRADLDLALAELRAGLPDLIAEYRPQGGFWKIFTACADLILGKASPDDLSHAWQQIDAMLQENGMPPLKESPAGN